jgi:putative transposase
MNGCSFHYEYIIPANTPSPTYSIQCKSLTKAKEQYPELKSVHSRVLQQTLKTLENAFAIILFGINLH